MVELEIVKREGKARSSHHVITKGNKKPTISSGYFCFLDYLGLGLGG